MNKSKAFAPATIANFIVGFDSLGASLVSLDEELFGDVVSIEQASCQSIEAQGPYAHELPQNAENIVTQCVQHFHQERIERGLPIETFRLQLEKRLPVCSGLGSSASSIVASLVALNAYYGNPFSNAVLLEIAGKMEGKACGSIHYDNVAPSLLGGLQLMVPGQVSEILPWFEDWLFVLYHPGIEVSTKMAREILPQSLSLASSVNYWQKFSSFIHALHTQNRKLAASMMNDTLIEPFRAKLIPHFEQGKQAALHAGALAFGISGSGPTCFAIVDSKTKALAVCAAIEDAMQGRKASFSKICKIDNQGARVIRHEII